MAKDLQESTKSGNSNKFIIAIISFFMLPIITVSILYFTNESFKYTANDFLGFLPGRIGGYFENQPTKEEKEELKNQIAKHYISLNEDRIVDKLLLIKGEDVKLYNDLLVHLNKLNPKKMNEVKDELRKREIKGDILYQIIEEIDLERTAKIDSLVKYYSSLSLMEALTEINSSFEKNEISSEELASVFERLPIDTGSRLLTLMDTSLSDRIRYLLPSSYRRTIDKQINDNYLREKEFIRLAKIYEEKAVDEIIKDIGNAEKYKIRDLAIIYSNMTYKKSGEILSTVKDQEFLFNLYNEIDRYDELNNLNENRSIGLAKSVQTIKDYNAKVLELAEVYQKMPRQDLAKIVEQMIRSNDVVILQEVGNERIIFTQQQLIVDVLNQFRSNIITEIMGHLDTRRTTELSKKLVE
ncbi:hypothetical protein [Serpentinicella alkaliphila]|uniref:Uncharacterized protein n=1 Tax=Serpentinicella alkaliphila TaxID=1734049 RepID=A0A4R2U6P9_9FIRM|nr:hypothetical protein [Serpentinicella alkaliphila]QUH26279.1 hypothetical protein HZR23_11440 [Serpentinicella alkaliphila]TCQ05859.1 hypothetical protein EDD79_100440 [Serpentinicella alkaliphila]